MELSDTVPGFAPRRDTPNSGDIMSVSETVVEQPIEDGGRDLGIAGGAASRRREHRIHHLLTNVPAPLGRACPRLTLFDIAHFDLGG